MKTLMDENRLRFIDILKIDIEGAEKELFQSPTWIESVRCLMIELHDRLKPGCSEAVTAAMAGFSAVTRGETVFYFRN